MAREIVAAIGTGQTEFKRHHSDKTYVELAQSAAKTALEDAGLHPDEIEAVVFSMAPTVWKGGAVSHTVDFAKVFVVYVLIFVLVTDIPRLRRIVYVQSASVVGMTGTSVNIADSILSMMATWALGSAVAY